MNCIETDTLLSVAEALGENAEQKVSHVAQCETCRAELADLAEWRAALAPAPLPPQVTDQVAAAVIHFAAAPTATDQRMVVRRQVAHAMITAVVVSLTLAAAVSFLQVMLMSVPILFVENWLWRLGLTSMIGLWVGYQGWRTQVRRGHTFASP